LGEKVIHYLAGNAGIHREPSKIYPGAQKKTQRHVPLCKIQKFFLKDENKTTTILSKIECLVCLQRLEKIFGLKYETIKSQLEKHK